MLKMLFNLLKSSCVVLYAKYKKQYHVKKEPMSIFSILKLGCFVCTYALPVALSIRKTNDKIGVK